MTHGLWLGLGILISFLVYRAMDGALGLAALFGVAAYMNHALRSHLAAASRATEDQEPRGAGRQRDGAAERS